jgi:hypothetical protein
MKLGMHLHELWRLRLCLLLTLLVATFASVSSAYEISFLPPGLQPRAMAMAAASTHVLVDNPDSVLLDVAQGTDQLNQMAQRALLLGNVMASLPVRSYIARRVGVPAQLIEVTSPVTPQYPRPIADDPQNQRRTTDLFRSNNQYRISIEANPTVPILDVYTEASSVRTAVALANAAVGGLRDYLTAVGDGESIAAGQQVRLEQLGGAQGSSVTGSVNVEVALLSFLVVFVLASAASLGLSRVAHGWKQSREAERLAGIISSEWDGADQVTDSETEREFVGSPR